MNYSSPQRARVSGHPAYAHANAILPRLCIEPLSESRCRVWAWCMVDWNSFEDRRIEVATADLDQLAAHYFADPEGFLAIHFNWKEPKGAKPLTAPPPKAGRGGLPVATSLADLGL